MSPWKADKIPDTVESPSSDGVPNPQTDRQPCISPLALKAKQKHAYRIRTCREERWELIEVSDSIKTMGNGNQNASLHAWNVKNYISSWHNFIVTLRISHNVFWSPSPLQPLPSLSTSYAPNFGSHPQTHLPLNLFRDAQLLLGVGPVLECDQPTKIHVFYEHGLSPPAAPERLEFCVCCLSLSRNTIVI